jgi:thymidylate kinase
MDDALSTFSVMVARRRRSKRGIARRECTPRLLLSQRTIFSSRIGQKCSLDTAPAAVMTAWTHESDSDTKPDILLPSIHVSAIKP